MILSGAKKVTLKIQMKKNVSSFECKLVMVIEVFSVCCSKSQISYLSEFKYRVTFDKRTFAKWKENNR